MVSCCEQHVFEMTEDVRTDRITLEAGEIKTILSFSVEDVEVVHPEIDEHFFKLAIRINSAVQLVLDQLGVHQLLWLCDHHYFTPQFRHVVERSRTERAQHLLALLGIEGINDGQLFLYGSLPCGADLVLRQ